MLKYQRIATMLLAIALPLSTEAATVNPGCEPIIKDCQTVVKKADEALKQKDGVIQSQTQLISKLNSDYAQSVRDVKQAQDEKDRWYHDPIYDVPIGAGVALGIAVSPLILITIPVIIVIGILK
jgi:hypothetical protein